MTVKPWSELSDLEKEAEVIANAIIQYEENVLPQLLANEREITKEECAKMATSVLGNPSPGAWPNVLDGASWNAACLRIADKIRQKRWFIPVKARDLATIKQGIADLDSALSKDDWRRHLDFAADLRGVGDHRPTWSEWRIRVKRYKVALTETETGDDYRSVRDMLAIDVTENDAAELKRVILEYLIGKHGVSEK